jgi:aminopeptidase N
VEEAGGPRIQTDLDRGADGRVSRIAFTQADPQGERNLLWTQQMNVLLGSATATRSVPLTLRGRETALPADRLPPSIEFVLPTGGGLAYGGFELDAGSRDFLVAHAHELQDPVARGSAWITLWDEMLEGRIRADHLLAALLRAAAAETAEQNVQLLGGYTRDIFWRFLSADQRAAAAPAVERTLQAGWERARPSSMKATFFNAFRSVVTTPSGVARLERVWRRDERIPGLMLAEPDEANMALDLAVRSVANAAGILDTQLQRFRNPDRKARFAFVLPALSADPATRDAWFSSLKDERNRRREPWVLEGLQYLNHPLRAAASAKYVRPALEMLEDIRRTGDIFFPRNWMDATLSGHSSREVAATVRAFLDERPDYPVRLRRIVLQSADDLFRAAQPLGTDAAQGGELTQQGAEKLRGDSR